MRLSEAAKKLNMSMSGVLTSSIWSSFKRNDGTYDIESAMTLKESMRMAIDKMDEIYYFCVDTNSVKELDSFLKNGGHISSRNNLWSILTKPKPKFSTMRGHASRMKILEAWEKYKATIGRSKYMKWKSDIYE